MALRRSMEHAQLNIWKRREVGRGAWYRPSDLIAAPQADLADENE